MNVCIFGAGGMVGAGTLLECLDDARVTSVLVVGRSPCGVTIAAARTLVGANPGMVFCYVSGTGTDSTERGRTMWARVTGRTEHALPAIGFCAPPVTPGGGKSTSIATSTMFRRHSRRSPRTRSSWCPLTTPTMECANSSSGT